MVASIMVSFVTPNAHIDSDDSAQDQSKNSTNLALHRPAWCIMYPSETTKKLSRATTNEKIFVPCIPSNTEVLDKSSKSIPLPGARLQPNRRKRALSTLSEVGLPLPPLMPSLDDNDVRQHADRRPPLRLAPRSLS